MARVKSAMTTRARHKKVLKQAKEALLVLMARIILGSVFSGNLMAIML